MMMMRGTRSSWQVPVMTRRKTMRVQVILEISLRSTGRHSWELLLEATSIRHSGRETCKLMMIMLTIRS